MLVCYVYEEFRINIRKWSPKISVIFRDAFTHNHVGHHKWASNLTCYSNSYIKDVAFSFGRIETDYYLESSTTKMLVWTLGKQECKDHCQEIPFREWKS